MSHEEVITPTPEQVELARGIVDEGFRSSIKELVNRLLGDSPAIRTIAATNSAVSILRGLSAANDAEFSPAATEKIAA